MVEFSIVIPNKNRTEKLKRAVNSAIQQSFDDYEIIIVDDSDPSIFNDLERYFLKFDKIKFIRGDGKGDAYARKIGYDMSKGRFVALLDSDDEWLPQKLEKHLNLLLSNESIGVTFDLWTNVDDQLHINQYENKQEKIPSTILDYQGNIIPPDIVRNKLIFSNFIHCSSGILVKEKLDSLGGFMPVNPADWMNWLRVSEKYYFGIVREYLTIKYISSDALGRGQNQKRWDEENSNVKKYALELVETYGYKGTFTIDRLVMLYLLLGASRNNKILRPIFNVTPQSLKDHVMLYLRNKYR